GRWLEETYPALQFHDHEVRYEVATIVESVGDELPGAAIADWLTRSNPLLGEMAPIDWFKTGLSLKTALHAVHQDAEEACRRVDSYVAVNTAAG
ncbi:MAG: hypothetical protein GY722_10485, partial [bacterium]|nr:hypothetical protein [bacterium]